MGKLNRTCVVCGTQYEYCHTCGTQKDNQTWRNSFCSENCRSVYHVVVEYGSGLKTKQEALNLLNQLDLTNRAHFTDATNRLIDEIKTVEPEKTSIEEKKTTIQKTYNNKKNNQFKGKR